MRIINRKIESDFTDTEDLGRVQASINSDGRIVLRTYNDSEQDSITVFSWEETNAIFSLFNEITAKFKNLQY